MTPRAAWRQVDWGFLLLLAVLCGLGLTVLWSASHGPDGRVAGYAARQARWMAIGGAVLAGALAFDYRRLESWAPWIYLGTLLTLAAVLAVGHTTMGAQRWIAVGPVRVQPSEFAKIAIAVVTAHVLARESSDPPYGLRPLLVPAAMVGLACLLVLLQPDLGTAVLMAGVAAVQILFQGVRRGVLVGGLG
ncbi:MAG: rod shape-determining protein RodA, partial [Candidatus Dadabacteria bacterium]